MCTFFHKHVLIVCKTSHKRAALLGNEVANWLQSLDYRVTVISAMEDIASRITSNTLLTVVLGGDGTILGVTRCLIGRRIPVFGINFGRVGYLTASQPEAWRESLTSFFNKQLPTYTCMALHWSLKRGGDVITSGYAVNDVVVSRGSLSRLLTLDVCIDDNDLGCLRSDGIIVSSSVGTSGYNVSAGGPILPPTMEMLAITPICAFQRMATSMVFPGSTICKITFSQVSMDCYMTVDGQEGQMLESGDDVILTGEPAAMHFVGRPNGFFDHLRSQCFTSGSTPCEMGEQA